MKIKVTIVGGDTIKLVGTSGFVNLTGSGSIKASGKIDVDGRMGIAIDAGTYTAPAIEFNALQGNVSVSADALEGEVAANAKSAKIGAKTGTLNIGQNKLLSGNHVYYNANGNVSLGSINHGTDNVAILASGDVSVSGNITAGDLFIGAGIGFTINGQYPSPIQDNDADVSWAATTLGYGTVDVGGTITTSQWLTVNAGYITLNDLTIGNSVLIDTPGGNGEFTVEGDIDVEHTFTVKAFYIDLQGDDFDVEDEVFLGNDGKSGYTTIAGTFKASKSVTFKSQEVKFDGVEFTMDGEDEDDKLITDASVKIEATDGISIKGDVETNRPANLLFFCDADVATGSITIDNSTGSWAGTLAIKANRNGGSSQFVIGGEDETNGVNGTIVTDTVDGGSTSTDSFWQGGVYISNHGDGGIKLTNATDISVKGTNSACGGIILDADDGTIELPAGTLSADGTGNFAGAVIQLLADALETEDGTIISASDNGQSGKAKNVQISVDTINLTGSSGLTIRCDGGGNATYKTALQILPKGCVVLYDSDEPSYFTIWSYVNGGEGSIPGSVNFEGGTSAPLNISANGSHSRIVITGYPVVFNTGDTVIECKGAEEHQIQMIKYVSSGSDGLQFNGGDVTIDASASSSDDGDGGTIEINIDHILRTSSGKATIKADGHGSGNGGQIDFYPGDVEDPLLVGSSDEQFSFSAKGGATDGDGGTINLYGWTASFEVHGASDSTTPINVSAPGADGNGGTINIIAYGGDGLVFEGTASYLKADSGTSSGNGGTIMLLAADAPIEISTDEEGAVSISAVSNGDGDGGTIDITAWAGLTVDTANIFATADGSGTGGNIRLSAGYSTFTLGGELNVDGGEEDGQGGIIELEGGEIIAAEDSSIVLNANGVGTANGGEVHILTNWGNFNIGDEGSVSANSGDEAGTGGLVEIDTYSELDLSEAPEGFISAKGADDGDGGIVTLTNVSSFDTDAVINVDPGPSFGGVVCLAGLTCEDERRMKTQNGVTVQKVFTENGDWPEFYWNGVNPGSEPSSLTNVPQDVIYNNLADRSGNDRIHLYVFNTMAQYNSFFKKSVIADQGDTHLGTETTPIIYSAVFQTKVGTETLLSEETLSEIAIHEIGHAFDYLIGRTNQSAGTTYGKYAVNDFLNFDWEEYDSMGGITPRDPAEAFAGLESYVFDSGVLKSEFVGWSNSHILQNIGTGGYFFTTHGDDTAWNELYAQALAMVAYAGPADHFAYDVPDNVFNNGFFPCVIAWAVHVQDGTATGAPPNTGDCALTKPTWYIIGDHI